MRKFPLTHTFGVTRKEYYKLTGITPSELIRFYQAENVALLYQQNQVRKWLRRKPFTSSEGRYLTALFSHIILKYRKNLRKIQKIEREDMPTSK